MPNQMSPIDRRFSKIWFWHLPMKHFEIVHEQLLFSENKTQINQSIHFDGLKRTFFQSAYGSLSTRSAGRNSFNLNINQFRFFCWIFIELFEFTVCSQIVLHYHRIWHDIYKQLVEQLRQSNIYDNHELISVIPK